MELKLGRPKPQLQRNTEVTRYLDKMGEPTEPLILLIGPTGSGKSSFIKALTNDRKIQTSGYKPCTTECTVHTFQIEVNGQTRRFSLIDTPGFGERPEDNLFILKDISKTLVDMLPRQVTGAIYFHRITDGRLTGTTRSILSIFKCLCGDEFFHHAVVVTTMWDTIQENKRARYEAINNQLEGGHMRLSPTGPGIFKRLQNNADFSKQVLEHFWERSRALHPPLLLVRQLGVSRTFNVRRTAAGKEIMKRADFGGGGNCTIL